jgi:hypothetical protein
MSDTKRSTAEFQRPPHDAFAGTAPGSGTTPAGPTRGQRRAEALWQGAEERGGDPYNATGRHAMKTRTLPED